jgi:hypothetical protein
MKSEGWSRDDISLGQRGLGLFIVNEGNYKSGNATLSFYDPVEMVVESEIFARANGAALGDVAQQMTIYGDTGYIVVNHSGIIHAVDPLTMRLKGSLAGLLSPRYIHFISSRKAYVTDLYASKITIFDPTDMVITGTIPTPAHTSTEQTTSHNDLVFVTCWHEDNTILVIDSQSDKIVDSIVIGDYPSAIVKDKNQKLWVVTGGFGSSSELYRIDAPSRRVEQVFPMAESDNFSKLTLNGSRDTLYYINRSLWRMSVSDQRLPLRPFIERGGASNYYCVGVDPHTSEIYLSDALDYNQRGVVYRYSPAGELIDKFNTGISPGAFCFANTDAVIVEKLLVIY